jgi:regulator of cell morphogenesis and NO signaling
MKKTLNLSLAELAICEPASIPIFEKYGIDYYQNGMRTLHEACMEKGLDDLLLYKEFSFQDCAPLKEPFTNFEEMSLERLIEHIKNVCHANESHLMPLILKRIKDLRIQLVDSHQELRELEIVFEEMMQELIAHAGIEEQIVFPYALKMMEMKKHKTKTLSQISLITNPMKMLEFEHEHTGSEIKIIRKITNAYSVPENSPVAYQLLMENLNEFENEFHQHIHLENNVLFPKIAALERELLISIRHHF